MNSVIYHPFFATGRYIWVDCGSIGRLVVLQPEGHSFCSNFLFTDVDVPLGKACNPKLPTKLRVSFWMCARLEKEMVPWKMTKTLFILMNLWKNSRSRG